MIAEHPTRIARKNWAVKEYENNVEFKTLMEGIEATYNQMLPSAKKYKV